MSKGVTALAPRRGDISDLLRGVLEVVDSVRVGR